MSQVTATSSSTATTANAATLVPTTHKTALTTDDFMKLLSTQMSNQDPLKPMDDTQSMAQLAQFSSLDQMNQLSKNFSVLSTTQTRSAAASYLGLQVTALDANKNSVSGVVTSVDTSTDTPKIEINGTYYPLSSVTSVALPSMPTTTTPTTTTGTN
jgi:flagellar basal-body rod modification protein FlgD